MNQANKASIKEWIDKAEGDYTTALALFKSKRKKNIYFIIAFHCQQANDITLNELKEVVTITKTIKPILVKRIKAFF